ncbi:hypothetical protein [Frigoriglobus tundricola]|uniref:Histidine kinase/HSP90-like ATPase domain-containing protein n=1 Tax=Frigoriglobus tundricola TaxID=2774151 RepID=A0A6M5Z480_9BACT|nr:hypothetical protein [Frigoriglobus tundricola]QJX01059.1 hypothetical protein FTUN_8698 [Frigoriglobus tundricola]
MNTTAPPESLLTVAVVEGLHSAALRRQLDLVTATVTGLTDTTLPGLVEYLCLRHSTTGNLQLPCLPPPVSTSLLGRALSQVTCPFGLRSSGWTPTNSSVNPREAEFFVLNTEAEYEGHDYRLFETRWARAAEAIGLRATQSSMQLAMTAMTENVLLHAESPVGLLVGYQMLETAVLFTVADLGRGVLGSLRTNPDYQTLQHPRDALRLALQEGVSRLGTGNGFGFRNLFRALASQNGTLRFRTGNVCITMDGQNFEADLGEETFPELMTGFQVTMCCRKSTHPDTAAPLL